jgi:hypothetical protein
LWWLDIGFVAAVFWSFATDIHRPLDFDFDFSQLILLVGSFYLKCLYLSHVIGRTSMLFSPFRFWLPNKCVKKNLKNVIWFSTKEMKQKIISLKQSTWFVMIEYRIHSYCVLIFCCWYRQTTLSIGIEKICGLLHFLTRTPHVVCCLQKMHWNLVQIQHSFQNSCIPPKKAHVLYIVFFWVNYRIYLMNVCLCRIWICLLSKR